MINYNDNNIIVGYIKQLLNDTNLPNAKVVKSNTILHNNVNYINNNVLFSYKNNKKITRDNNYKWNKYVRNYTHNLKINSIYYDGETHKRLGDYLRFIRDYFNVNLMQLYNCFVPESLTNFYYNNDSITFDSDDNTYKLYMLPVKFDSVYTIAIESETPIELMCCFYDKSETIKNEDLYKLTYKKVNYSRFSKPFLYKNLNQHFDGDLFSQEQNLKLLIKVPNDLSSTITILEGDYTKNNQFTLDNTNLISYNRSIVNFEVEDINNIHLVSSSQLLYINTGVSYPFSDKLISYLVGNTITPLDKISDNIKRVQNQLRKLNYIASIKYPGFWQDNYKYILYNIAQNNKLSNKNDLDILGYVDKDLERLLSQLTKGGN